MLSVVFFALASFFRHFLLLVLFYWPYAFIALWKNIILKFTICLKNNVFELLGFRVQVSENWWTSRRRSRNCGKRKWRSNLRYSREFTSRAVGLGRPGRGFLSHRWKRHREGRSTLLLPEAARFNSLCVQILYSEQRHESLDDSNADREVTSTFNPEAQCFRPIEIISSSFNGLSLSPKNSPNDLSPTSSTSPLKSNSPSNSTKTFLGRQQEPVLFTTAAFAKTKFGSTKMKNNSKRTNR